MDRSKEWLTPYSTDLFEKPVLPLSAKKFVNFMEPEISSPPSKHLDNFPYLKKID
jgi:hypothetical protein